MKYLNHPIVNDTVREMFQVINSPWGLLCLAAFMAIGIFIVRGPSRIKGI